MHLPEVKSFQMVRKYAEDIRRSYHDSRCRARVFCRGKLHKTLSLELALLFDLLFTLFNVLFTLVLLIQRVNVLICLILFLSRRETARERNYLISLSEPWVSVRRGILVYSLSTRKGSLRG